MSATSAQAIRQVAPWIEILARLGYGAKAVLYGTVGLLAAQAALGTGHGKATDTRGALHAVLGAPYGRHALLLIAAGLAGYAIWRLIEALADPERRGTSAKGLAVRAGFVGRGLAHGALAVAAFRLATGRGDSGNGGPDRWTAWVFGLPGGTTVVWVVAAVVGGYGFYQLHRAWKAKLGHNLAVSRLPAGSARAIVGVSRFGIGARGAVFCLIGFFLARAASRHDPAAAGGIRESLLVLAGVGRWALGAAALGLLAYGVYQLVEARYRRIDVA